MTQVREGLGAERAADAVRDAVATTGRGLARISDAGVRQRIHGVALLFAGMTGLATSMMMGENGLMTVAGAAMGCYGLYLSRR